MAKLTPKYTYWAVVIFNDPFDVTFPFDVTLKARPAMDVGKNIVAVDVNGTLNKTVALS